MANSIYAVIPARGGSKGILRKNLRDIGGNPLIYYTIQCAKDSHAVDRFFVSTEDKEIAKVSLELGSEVIERPKDLAGDNIPSSQVIKHAIEYFKESSESPDYIVMLQPTSPLRQAKHLKQCLKEMLDGNYNSAVSVIEFEHHPYKSLILEKDARIEPLKDWETMVKSRQLLPKAYRTTGAIYAVKTELFEKEGNFFLNPIHLFHMDSDSSVDVDNETDINLVERILAGN